MYECDEGWHPLIDRTLAKIKELEPDFTIFQIKEKFGGLRIYGHPITDEIDNIISDAEDESYHTCEVCGAPGKVRETGWIKTLCDEHAKR